MAGYIQNLNVCPHLSQSEIEGFLICIVCGLALDDIVFCRYENKVTFLSDKENPFPNSFLEKQKREIYDAHQKNFISFQVFELSVSLIEKWCKTHSNLKKYFYLHAILYASRKLSYPISIKDISNFFSVPIRKFSRLEKIFPIEEDCLSSNFIKKYGTLLNFSFSKIQNACKVGEMLEKHFSVRTNIISTLSLMYMDDSLSYKNVQKYVNISKSSILKYKQVFFNFLNCKKNIFSD